MTSGPCSKLSINSSRVMSVLQTSMQTPCRRFNCNVHLTTSESSYLVCYPNNYFEEHSERSIASWNKVLSWLLQLPKRLKCLSFEQTCGLTTLICLFAELSDQIQRAIQLEEERKRAQEEAERLEAERLAALQAKEELERQTMDQIKSQEQLVRLSYFESKIHRHITVPLSKAKPSCPGKNSAVRYWAVIVALVSIISNLIFSS